MTLNRVTTVFTYLQLIVFIRNKFNRPTLLKDFYIFFGIFKDIKLPINFIHVNKIVYTFNIFLKFLFTGVNICYSTSKMEWESFYDVNPSPSNYESIIDSIKNFVNSHTNEKIALVTVSIF